MKAKYDLDKIRFATDRPTFEKAVALYESGKVTDFEDNEITYTATVFGTQPYKVWISPNKYDEGDCDCYLGKNGTHCKHMVALAIRVVMSGKLLTKANKQIIDSPACSGDLAELDKEELKSVKDNITKALRFIKPYDGPSRIWFTYQNSLSEGCKRLSAILSKLPVSLQTAILVLDLLIRLDNKLVTGGVDDSDGTVGEFIESSVNMLQEFAKHEPACIKAFEILNGHETCFGWEEDLLKLIPRRVPL